MAERKNAGPENFHEYIHSNINQLKLIEQRIQNIVINEIGWMGKTASVIDNGRKAIFDYLDQ